MLSGYAHVSFFSLVLCLLTLYCRFNVTLTFAFINVNDENWSKYTVFTNQSVIHAHELDYGFDKYKLMNYQPTYLLPGEKSTLSREFNVSRTQDNLALFIWYLAVPFQTHVVQRSFDDIKNDISSEALGENPDELHYLRHTGGFYHNLCYKFRLEEVYFGLTVKNGAKKETLKVANAYVSYCDNEGHIGIFEVIDFRLKKLNCSGFKAGCIVHSDLTIRALSTEEWQALALNTTCHELTYPILYQAISCTDKSTEATPLSQQNKTKGIRGEANNIVIGKSTLNKPFSCMKYLQSKITLSMQMMLYVTNLTGKNNNGSLQELRLRWFKDGELITNDSQRFTFYTQIAFGDVHPYISILSVDLVIEEVSLDEYGVYTLEIFCALSDNPNVNACPQNMTSHWRPADWKEQATAFLREATECKESATDWQNLALTLHQRATYWKQQATTFHQEATNWKGRATKWEGLAVEWEEAAFAWKNLASTYLQAAADWKKRALNFLESETGRNRS